MRHVATVFVPRLLFDAQRENRLEVCQEFKEQ